MVHTIDISYEFIKYVMVLYLVGSFMEWFIHKYIMHGDA